MITEYDISKFTEKFPDPWIRLIEYFPLSTKANVLRSLRYTLVRKQYVDFTTNDPAIQLVVWGNYFNDERVYEVNNGGVVLFKTSVECDADSYFSELCLLQNTYDNP